MATKLRKSFMIMDEESSTDTPLRVEPGKQPGAIVFKRGADVFPIFRDEVDLLVRAIEEIQLENWQSKERSDG